MDVRAGNQDKDMMYESAFGPVTVFYNGYAYGTRETGIYLQHVIYIPKSTKDTKEAYIEAAQKRINDYLGKDNGVLVTYGGLISSLPEFAEDIDNLFMLSISISLFIRLLISSSNSITSIFKVNLAS